MKYRVGIEKLSETTYAVCIFTADFVHMFTCEAPADIPDRARVSLEMARAMAIGAVAGFDAGVLAERTEPGSQEVDQSLWYRVREPGREERMAGREANREVAFYPHVLEWAERYGSPPCLRMVPGPASECVSGVGGPVGEITPELHEVMRHNSGQLEQMMAKSTEAKP